MDLNTAAAVISYTSKIEQESARFYEKWGEVHEILREAFSSFVKENKKSEKNIKRAYYNVVSDALETGFSFKGLKADVNVPSLDNDASPYDVLKASIEMETGIQEFYLKAAELSRSLLADVPRVMGRVATSRDIRVARLRSMLEEME